MLDRLQGLQEDLGRGNSCYLISSSVIFSIILFFYLLDIVSYLEPIVYPLIDRITYPSYFEDKHFINNQFDSLIIILCTILWFQFGLISKIKYFIMTAFGIISILIISFNLEFMKNILVSISFPTILVFIIMNKLLKKSNVSFDLRLCINYIALFGIAIVSVSAIVIVSYILFSEKPSPQLNYLYNFFMILSLFSPIYLVLVAFNYPLIWSLRALRKKWNKNSNTKRRSVIIKDKHSKRRNSIVHLSLVIFLSIIVSMIPHLGTINKDNQVIGSDTKYYIRLLKSIGESSSTFELLYKTFVSFSNSDRPFSLLFFFWLSSTFYQGNFYFLLEDLPILLSPLLVLTTYFLTLRITRHHLASILACVITIPSHILIGIYAGLYANWFALVWGYLAILFLFKLLDEPKKINLVIFSVLLIILLFSHAQTWTIFMYVIGLFLVIVFFKNRKNRKPVLYPFISVLPSVFGEIARTLLINNSGIKQEIVFASQREIGIHGINTIWNNLIDTSHLYLAGQIANPIILLLIIYWLYSAELKTNYAIFFVVFFSLLALPLLLSDATVQARFFYEIPFQVPAAIALIVLKERIGSFMPFAICLWLIVMSIYMVSNFVLVVPEKYL